MLKQVKYCLAFICMCGMLIGIFGCTKENKVDVTGYYLDGLLLEKEGVRSMGRDVEKDGVDDGDHIQVTCDGSILESYPAKFGKIFDVVLKTKGEVEDIPKEYYKSYQDYLDFVEDAKHE